MTALEAVLYGVVQGITEWLPISSTAHLRLLPALLHRPDPGAGFTAVIQLGTTLAVILYFWRDLTRVLGGWARHEPRASREAWGVFWGTIPIVVVGLALKDVITSDQVRSLYVIATTLLLGAGLMFAAERTAKGTRGEEDVQVRDGVMIGLFQALALVPGMSRSGSTISGALLSGFDRVTAARYSFLLSIPSVLAAGVFELYQERRELASAGVGNVLIATVVSFAVGYASIAFLLKSIARYGFGPYIVYRIGLAGLLMLAVSQGWIPAGG